LNATAFNVIELHSFYGSSFNFYIKISLYSIQLLCASECLFNIQSYIQFNWIVFSTVKLHSIKFHSI